MNHFHIAFFAPRTSKLDPTLIDLDDFPENPGKTKNKKPKKRKTENRKKKTNKKEPKNMNPKKWYKRPKIGSTSVFVTFSGSIHLPFHFLGSTSVLHREAQLCLFTFLEARRCFTRKHNGASRGNTTVLFHFSRSTTVASTYALHANTCVVHQKHKCASPRVTTVFSTRCASREEK